MRGHFAERDYLGVLQLIERQLQKGAAEIDFAPEYSRALNGLLQQARQNKEQSLHAAAGHDFRQAFELYPSEPHVAAQVDMSTGQLERAVASCSEALMEQGLIAYRAGHLGEAIGVWKKILTFSPSHQPAIKAIHTAEIQLKNLKALRPEQEGD